jgi:hypothetical protein
MQSAAYQRLQLEPQQAFASGFAASGFGAVSQQPGSQHGSSQQPGSQQPGSQQDTSQQAGGQHGQQGSPPAAGWAPPRDRLRKKGIIAWKIVFIGSH